MILVLVYISFGFLCLQMINVLINYLFSQPFRSGGNPNTELVSVLIPARDEEANIGNLLEALHNAKNDNIEIIVCNDHSTDVTERVVLEYAANDNRVQLIQSEEIPKGWLGKNFACYQLARAAGGKHLLFIDADVVLSGEVVSDAVAYAQRFGIGLLSVFPKQILKTAGEKKSVPLMNFILLTLLPLVFVRVSPFKSHSAANGQFMLFDADTYREYQPHERFKESAVEDIAIARFLKGREINTACVTGEERIECRMYNSYQDSLKGFSKNIFSFFGNSPFLAFLFWILSSFGIIPVLMFDGFLTLVYLLGVVLVQMIYAMTCKQNVADTLRYFPANLFFMLRVMIQALRVKRKGSYLWKGRNICS
jgi:glycosyltransferase involved in cell wall biosynthesis